MVLKIITVWGGGGSTLAAIMYLETNMKEAPFSCFIVQ